MRCFCHTLRLAINSHAVPDPPKKRNRDALFSSDSEEEVEEIKHNPNSLHALLPIAQKSTHYRAPCETRWWSVFEVLVRCITDSDALTFEERSKIHGALLAFSPVREAGKELEKTDTTLPKALRIYLQLIQVVEDRELKMLLVDRMFRMERDSLLECVFLSPMVDWNALRESKVTLYMHDQFKRIKKAGEWTRAERETRSNELGRWCACALQQSEDEITSSLSGFWDGGASSILHWMHKSAQRLIDVRATEAAAERYFSAQSLVHSRLRSRLKDVNLYAECTIRFRDLNTFVEEPSLEEDAEVEAVEVVEEVMNLNHTQGKLEEELRKRGRSKLGWDTPMQEKLQDCINTEEAQLFFEIYSTAARWDLLNVGDKVTVTLEKDVPSRKRDVCGKIIKKNIKSVPSSFTYKLGDNELTVVPAYMDTPWTL